MKKQAGGMPREFAAVLVSDGISMNHEGMKFSLVTETVGRSSGNRHRPHNLEGQRAELRVPAFAGTTDR